MDRIDRVMDALEAMPYGDVIEIWEDYCDIKHYDVNAGPPRLEALAGYIADTGRDFGYIKIEIALEDEEEEEYDFLEPYFGESLEHLDKMRI